MTEAKAVQCDECGATEPIRGHSVPHGWIAVFHHPVQSRLDFCRPACLTEWCMHRSPTRVEIPR
jgi:hypothetical protein